MDSSKREFTCIVCPKGCDILVWRHGAGNEWLVSGNGCEKGHEYVVGEMTSPVRVLTATVALGGAEGVLLPVRTSAPVPRDKLMMLMNIIASIRVDAPLRMGDMIAENIGGTGADLVASRSVRRECTGGVSHV